MLRSVNVGNRSLADYHSIVSRELMSEIHDLADKLKGKRVCHINATSFGRRFRSLATNSKRHNRLVRRRTGNLNG